MREVGDCFFGCFSKFSKTKIHLKTADWETVREKDEKLFGAEGTKSKQMVLPLAKNEKYFVGLHKGGVKNSVEAVECAKFPHKRAK